MSLAMLKDKMDYSLVAKYTQLSVEQIHCLAQENHLT